jgi:hypothetical protein
MLVGLHLGRWTKQILVVVVLEHTLSSTWLLLFKNVLLLIIAALEASLEREINDCNAKNLTEIVCFRS